MHYTNKKLDIGSKETPCKTTKFVMMICMFDKDFLNNLRLPSKNNLLATPVKSKLQNLILEAIQLSIGICMSK
jgi:hypothetical protein